MRLLAALLGFLAAACSPLAILNAAVPGDTYSLHEGIAFGTLARQRLDVYAPSTGSTRPRPVVMFLYGGSWQGGERKDFRFVGEALASRGFVVVVPDYRVYPEARYPAFVQDAAAAFAWTRREIARFGGDPAHIVVMGHSAGAHIGAMLAYNQRFLREVGLAARDVHAFIGLAGPYDFRPEEPAITAALSGEGDPALAMVPRYVERGAPPALLLQGEDDRRVSPVNQQRLEKRLRETGNSVDARILPGLGHPGIIAKLARPIRDDALLETIAAFAAR